MEEWSLVPLDGAQEAMPPAAAPAPGAAAGIAGPGTVAADTGGRIAFKAVGRVPVRAAGNDL
ncbi:hypothetical protein C8244_11975, partial [Paracidovorax avenae]